MCARFSANVEEKSERHSTDNTRVRDNDDDSSDGGDGGESDKGPTYTRVILQRRQQRLFRCDGGGHLALRSKEEEKSPLE